ncbi:MAG TPA: hypothetical protein VE861_16440 [Gemmatimonadaceae bacterium]|nr:hypothetical protein [Gemmatimonadaceae bacterium]
MTFSAFRHRSRRIAVALLGLSAVLLTGCKNPVDAALDIALDFDGLYTASDGTIVELNEDSGVIVTAGSGATAAGLRVGDLYFSNVRRTSVATHTADYTGSVRTSSGAYVTGTITLGTSGSLVVLASSQISSHIAWMAGAQTITNPTNPSTPTTPPTPTTPTTGTTTIFSQSALSGALRSTRTWKITVPTGAKQLLVTTSEDAGGYNVPDLFVRQGSAAVISRPNGEGYTWTATCASVESNRAPERCAIPNPPAGDWYISLYGYNDSYYGVSLKATITR